MNRLGAALLFAASLGGCATLPERAAGTSLAQLISFESPALCEPAPAFAAFLGSMTEGDANEGFRVGRIAAPPTLSPHIGPIKVRKKGGYWVASVTVAGHWLGLPIIAIHQNFPEGGDPGDFQIEFDAPLVEVEQRLRAAGFPARANVEVPLGEPEGYDHLMTLESVPGRPGRSLFGCGYS